LNQCYDESEYKTLLSTLNEHEENINQFDEDMEYQEYLIDNNVRRTTTLLKRWDDIKEYITS